MKQILLTSLLALFPLGAVLGQAAATPPPDPAPAAPPAATSAPPVVKQPRTRRVVTPPTRSKAPPRTRSSTNRQSTGTVRPSPSAVPRVTPVPPTRSQPRTSYPARSRTGSVQPVPPRTSPNVGVGRTPTRTSSSIPGDLNSNITMSLKGSLLGLFDVDFDLTGCGPQTRAEFVIPSTKDDIPASIATVTYTVSESRGSYRVDYSVGARIAQVTQIGGDGRSKNIEFRNVMLNGAVRLGDGESVVLSKVNNKTLTLSISPKEKKQARNNAGAGAGALLGAAVGALATEDPGDTEDAGEEAPQTNEVPTIEAP